MYSYDNYDRETGLSKYQDDKLHISFGADVYSIQGTADDYPSL